MARADEAAACLSGGAQAVGGTRQVPAGQRQQHAGGVAGEVHVAQPRQAVGTLQGAEHAFDPAAHLADQYVAARLGGAQRPVFLAPPLHPVLVAGGGDRLCHGRADIGLVGPHRTLVAATSWGPTVISLTLAGVSRARRTIPAPQSTPTCSLYPKCAPPRARFAQRASGSALARPPPRCFGGSAAAAAISVASISVPAFTTSPCRSSCRFTSANKASARPRRRNSSRNRHSVEWSGTAVSRASPAKRRNDSRSASVASSSGSPSPCHAPSSTALNRLRTG